MNDEQLATALRSMGQSCFVKYYHLFADERMSREDVIDTLRTEEGYTENSCITRTTHARRILRAERGADALRLVISSDSPRVSEAIRERARKLL